MKERLYVPDGNHVVVHLLQLLLGHLHGVWWGVKLVCLETLIAEGDLEWLLVGLQKNPAGQQQGHRYRREDDEIGEAAYRPSHILG
jgi:hypothetical protein